MKRFQLMFENRWRVYKPWMVVHPLVSVQVAGVTVFGLGFGKFIQIEILNFCMTIHS